MKNTIFYIILMVTGGVSRGQGGVQITVPGHAIAASIPFGTIISDTITNTGSGVAVFKPLIPQLQAMIDDHVQGLIQGVTGTLQEKKWQVMLREYAFIKSTYRFNGLPIANPLPADNPDSLNTMFYGANSWLGIPYMQCNNSVMLFIHDVVSTGLFSAGDSICNVSFSPPSGHDVLQWRDSSSWWVIDCDPQEPGGISKGSIWDLMRNHALINRYYYSGPSGDSIDLCPLESLDEYYQLLDSNRLNIQPVDLTSLVPAHQLPDSWIMYPGSNVIWRCRIGSLIDTTGAAGLQVWDNFCAQLQAGHDTAHSNAAFSGPAGYLGITVDSSELLYIQNLLMWFGGTAWSPAFTTIVPKLEVNITSDDDTVWMGADERIPMVVTDVTTNGPVVLARGLVVTDSVHFNNWAMAYSGQHPSIGYQNFQFLDGGFIPPHTTVKFLGAYNPRAYNWFQGFFVQTLDSCTLSVTGDSTMNSTPLAIGAPRPSAGFEIFPNPATGKICVAGTTGTVSLYDLSGRCVLTIQNDNSPLKMLDVKSLARAEYILRDATGAVQKLVLQ